MNTYIPKTRNKDRDTKIIHCYYGFQKKIEPTYDEVAKKYNAGETDGRKTELGSNIVENYFKNNVRASDLPSAVKLSEIISSRKIISSTELFEIMRRLCLIDSEANLLGLIKFLHDLKLVENYDVYTPELAKVTKRTYLSSNKLFFIEKDEFNKIRQGLQDAKKLPKSIGIAKLSFLKQSLGEEFIYFNELIEILKSNEDSWFYELNGETYYLLETLKHNTMINNMKRTKCVSQTFDLDRLTYALRRAFFVRTAKHFEYPSPEIIRIYLKKSKYTTLKGTDIELDLECSSLTSTEKEVVALLREYPNEKYELLKEKLKESVEEDISDSTISNSFYNSPLICVDESGERKDYKFSLIGKSLAENSSKDETDRDAEYTQRLKNVSKEGTDREQSVMARNEQKILRDWLFKGKVTENCAICGEGYSKELLIAAHKKNRAECAENERRDIRIVMPLCKFGCDAMYEEKYLRIRDGKVIKGITTESLTEREKSYVESVIGKSVDERWLKGNESYFE